MVIYTKVIETVETHKYIVLLSQYYEIYVITFIQQCSKLPIRKKHKNNAATRVIKWFRTTTKYNLNTKLLMHRFGNV